MGFCPLDAENDEYLENAIQLKNKSQQLYPNLIVKIK